MPPGLLARLGLRWLKTEEQFAWKYENHPYDDDVKIQQLAHEESSGDEEDWERHESLRPGDQDEGRMLGSIHDQPLMEWEIENPWDKQEASGLVMWTDQTYWDAQKGDFDERTADDFDVEVQDDPEAKRERIRMNAEEETMRERAKQRRERMRQMQLQLKRKRELERRSVEQQHTGTSKSQADCTFPSFSSTPTPSSTSSSTTSSASTTSVFISSSSSSSPASLCSFAAPTHGLTVASNILSRQGWVAGTGLGKHQQGRPSALVPHALRPGERSGVGFGSGEKQGETMQGEAKIANGMRQAARKHAMVSGGVLYDSPSSTSSLSSSSLSSSSSSSDSASQGGLTTEALLASYSLSPSVDPSTSFSSLPSSAFSSASISTRHQLPYHLRQLREQAAREHKRLRLGQPLDFETEPIDYEAYQLAERAPAPPSIGSVYDHPSTHPGKAMERYLKSLDPQVRKRKADKAMGSFEVPGLTSLPDPDD